jgi:hypothetical protein
MLECSAWRVASVVSAFSVILAGNQIFRLRMRQWNRAHLAASVNAARLQEGNRLSGPVAGSSASRQHYAHLPQRPAMGQTPQGNQPSAISTPQELPLFDSRGTIHS